MTYVSNRFQLSSSGGDQWPKHLGSFFLSSVFLRQSSMRPSPLGINGAKQPKAIIWPQLIQCRGGFRTSETPQPTTLHHRWWYPQRYILLKEGTANSVKLLSREASGPATWVASLQWTQKKKTVPFYLFQRTKSCFKKCSRNNQSLRGKHSW